MKNSNKILGICIPTFNRADILKKNLENLITKISDKDITIYVSDNNSSDNTEEIVLNIAKSYKHIVYQKNSENIGSAKNFEMVLSMCKEKYAWLLGDDDTIVGDINIILEILERKEWDFVVLGVYGKIGKSKEYCAAHDVFKELLGSMIWISALIINIDIIKKMVLIENKNPHFSHAGALTELLSVDNANVYYYYDKLIVKAMSNELVEWADRGFEIFSEKWIDFVLSMSNEYSLEEKKIAITNLPSSPWRWRILLVYRSKGFFTFARLHKQKDKICNVSTLHYFVMLLISLMPKFIARVILDVALKIKFKARKMNLMN